MNSNKGNMNDNDKTGDIIYWAIIIIFLFAFPPVGLILLLAKLGVFSSSSKNNTSPVKKINKRRSRLEKKTGKGLSVFLLIVAIGLFAAGVTVIANSLAYLAVGGLGNIARFGLGVFYVIGALIAFFSRNIVAKRLIRYKNYYAFINERGIVPLADIAQTTGVSVKTIIRDVHAMINSGFLDPGAYIDNELECLVLSAEDAHKLRMDVIGSQVTHAVQSDDASAKSYSIHLAEFREVRASIKDEVISDKISRLEELCTKIFKIVEESPEKQPQIRRFMSYYLPTTLKLVRSYATLESQGIKGENIVSTKKSISGILDTLLVGYEQQLDQLFKSDAIDIATDINVLENLMQQDGLTGTTFSR